MKKGVSPWYLIQAQPSGCHCSGYCIKGTGRNLWYKITQDVRSVLDVSESTLYPVLRRLQKDECLETYDMAYEGRNRRYYKLTEKGSAQLNLYKVEWKNYSSKISNGCLRGELIYEQKRIYGPAGKAPL